jgi:Sec-independent protein secretion pathway component TatC
MDKHEKKLIDILALLTIVVSLSSVGSMYVYYVGTFTKFLLPIWVNQMLVMALGIASFAYLIMALRQYHKKG